MMNHDVRSETKADETKESDEMTRPTKRARFESEGGSTPSNVTIPRSIHRRGRRFLRLHLQLLKALYETEVDTVTVNTTTTTGTFERTRSEERDMTGTRHEEDPPVTNTLCTTIESFLRDRGRVQSLDATVQHYRDLYEDALDFMDEQSHKEGSSSRNHGSSSIPVWPSLLVTQQGSHGGSGPLVHANTIMRQALLFQGGQNSPFASTSHFYHHALQSSTNHLRNSNAARGGNGDLLLSVKPFGLVAGLIQAKYQNSVDHLQETTIPFEPLITEVRKRIETLETLLDSLFHDKTRDQHDGLHPNHYLYDSLSSGINGVSRDHWLCTTMAVENEEEEEGVARIETKVKLWKLLEMDLLNP